MNKSSMRELLKEKNYWKRFYFRFTEFMYSKRNCHDNYVGSTIKLIRSFFNYLNYEKGINTGEYYKHFYVRGEEIPIIALNSQQLNFLIYNMEFENSLTQTLQRAKDIFVFGCTVGLRVGDLVSLKLTNIERVNNDWYIKMVSKKTGTFTRIKLPVYAVDILKKYSGKFNTLLPKAALQNLNNRFRVIAQMAGWTNPVIKVRHKRGVTIELKRQSAGDKTTYRFCDLVSSHTMRRTAITNLLCLGMPEHLVRKISGHAAGSKEFYKYVHYSQSYIDVECDKAFAKLIERHSN